MTTTPPPAMSGGLFGELAPHAFIKAWIGATDHQDIEFTDRQMGDGTWIVLARIGSVIQKNHFAALLTPEQCRGVADAFAGMLDKTELAEIVQAMSDLVVALRAAADECERLHPGPVT